MCVGSGDVIVVWKEKEEEEAEEDERGGKGNSNAEFFNVLSSMTSGAKRLERIERSSCRLRDSR